MLLEQSINQICNYCITIYEQFFQCRIYHRISHSMLFMYIMLYMNSKSLGFKNIGHANEKKKRINLRLDRIQLEELNPYHYTDKSIKYQDQLKYCVDCVT